MVYRSVFCRIISRELWGVEDEGLVYLLKFRDNNGKKSENTRVDIFITVRRKN